MAAHLAAAMSLIEDRARAASARAAVLAVLYPLENRLYPGIMLFELGVLLSASVVWMSWVKLIRIGAYRTGLQVVAYSSDRSSCGVG
jgi:hypothetical protein